MGTFVNNVRKYILHGKHGKQLNAEPTTEVEPIHAQQTSISDPNITDHHLLQQQHHIPVRDGFSVAPGGDNRNIPAQAADVAAHVAGQHQRKGNGGNKDGDTAVLERIVSEDREKQGKLPYYVGLERWKLLDKMGDGAFSNVYRAQDTQSPYQEVAIKVVRKFEMNSGQGDNILHPDVKLPKAIERANILKEVQIMRQLDHPNIVKLISFHESKQHYFIILELCPGGELFHQIVKFTYFSEDLSRHVIVQVAKALEYLHEEKGVVHRDIKPENLLFYPTPFIPSKNRKPKSTDEDDKADEGEFVAGVGAGGIGHIKIADFGLSKVLWDDETQTPCGTVGYTAPEIVKDERYSKSVDMWALGCVLYTLLCGFPPFYDESIQTLTEKVAKAQYTFLSPWWDDISQSAQNLISHLLTVVPEKRYDIKQFLNHPWIRNANEESTPAEDAPLPSARLTSNSLFQDPRYGYLEDGPSKRADFRSPGAVNLREVFDVGYAVHRQEEAKRRKDAGYAGTLLNPLEEDEDEEVVSYDSRSQATSQRLPRSSNANDVGGVERQMRNTSLSAAAQARQAAAIGSISNKERGREERGREERGYGQHSPQVAAEARRTVKNKPLFDLSLDNATLLGRRKKPGPGSSSLREQMVQSS